MIRKLRSPYLLLISLWPSLIISLVSCFLSGIVLMPYDSMENVKTPIAAVDASSYAIQEDLAKMKAASHTSHFVPNRNSMPSKANGIAINYSLYT